MHAKLQLQSAFYMGALARGRASKQTSRKEAHTGHFADHKAIRVLISSEHYDLLQAAAVASISNSSPATARRVTPSKVIGGET